jgi:hypothetical protein
MSSTNARTSDAEYKCETADERGTVGRGSGENIEGVRVRQTPPTAATIRALLSS